MTAVATKMQVSFCSRHCACFLLTEKVVCKQEKSYRYRLWKEELPYRHYTVFLECRDGIQDSYDVLHDFTTDEKVARQFFTLLWKNQVSPIHLRDVFEDYSG